MYHFAKGLKGGKRGAGSAAPKITKGRAVRYSRIPTQIDEAVIQDIDMALTIMATVAREGEKKTIGNLGRQCNQFD